MQAGGWVWSRLHAGPYMCTHVPTSLIEQATLGLCQKPSVSRDNFGACSVTCGISDAHKFVCTLLTTCFNGGLTEKQILSGGGSKNVQC